jgi:hypothetical protein
MQRSEAELAQATRDNREAAKNAQDRRPGAARDTGEQSAAEPWRINERELDDVQAAHPEAEPSPEPEDPWHLSQEREPEARSASEHDLEAAG